MNYNRRENAQIKQIEAETRYTERKEKKLKNESLLMNIGFIFRWIIVWLTVGGFIKLEFIQEVTKWMNG